MYFVWRREPVHCSLSLTLFSLTVSLLSPLLRGPGLFRLFLLGLLVLLGRWFVVVAVAIPVTPPGPNTAEKKI